MKKKYIKELAIVLTWALFAGLVQPVVTQAPKAVAAETEDDDDDEDDGAPTPTPRPVVTVKPAPTDEPIPTDKPTQTSKPDTKVDGDMSMDDEYQPPKKKWSKKHNAYITYDKNGFGTIGTVLVDYDYDANWYREGYDIIIPDGITEISDKWEGGDIVLLGDDGRDDYGKYPAARFDKIVFPKSVKKIGTIPCSFPRSIVIENDDCELGKWFTRLVDDDGNNLSIGHMYTTVVCKAGGKIEKLAKENNFLTSTTTKIEPLNTKPVLLERSTMYLLMKNADPDDFEWSSSDNLYAQVGNVGDDSPTMDADEMYNDETEDTYKTLPVSRNLSSGILSTFTRVKTIHPASQGIYQIYKSYLKLKKDKKVTITAKHIITGKTYQFKVTVKKRELASKKAIYKYIKKYYIMDDMNDFERIDNLIRWFVSSRIYAINETNLRNSDRVVWTGIGVCGCQAESLTNLINDFMQKYPSKKKGPFKFKKARLIKTANHAWVEIDWKYKGKKLTSETDTVNGYLDGGCEIGRSFEVAPYDGPGLYLSYFLPRQNGNSSTYRNVYNDGHVYCRRFNLK